jgi:hypothetical protein
MRVLLTKQEDEVRKSRFSEEQIIGLLKEAEAGRKVADLCREHGISEARFPARNGDEKSESLSL